MKFSEILSADKWQNLRQNCKEVIAHFKQGFLNKYLNPLKQRYIY